MLNLSKKALSGMIAMSITIPAFATTPQIQSNNALGLNWAQKTVQIDAKENGGKLKNTMVSPISAYSAVSMLNAGLSGQTKADLFKVLKLENSAAVGVDAENKKLLSSLVMGNQETKPASACGTAAPKNESQGDNFRRPKGPVVGIHNSAWGTSNIRGTGKAFEFNPAYLSSLKGNYSATVRSDLDFRKPEAALAVNNWAAEKTNCLIPEIITPDIMKDLIWVLMNATYVEASWETPFRAVRGEAPKFTTSESKQVSANMIRKTERMNKLTGPGYVAVEIPFYTEKAEDDLSFFILMPNTVAEFVKESKSGSLYSMEVWEALLSRFSASQAKRIDLTIPKFDFKYSMTMTAKKELTKALGLDFLFEDGPVRAKDFMTLGNPSSRVGIIKQDTKIELDEYGVKAAAVTLIGGMERTSIPERAEELVIDKPFAFAIGSKKSGALLFVGSVVDPTQK